MYAHTIRRPERDPKPKPEPYISNVYFINNDYNFIKFPSIGDTLKYIRFSSRLSRITQPGFD